MRTPVVAGNWKMNTSVAEAEVLTRDLARLLHGVEGVEVVLCPPFVSLAPLAQLLPSLGVPFDLGAQNAYCELSGAFTGEVSPAMLKGLAKYVILGHSERRKHFGESSSLVNKKTKLAIECGLLPIVCVGEDLEQRESGRTDEVVREQVVESLAGIRDGDSVVVAYEPVWAIGTGRAATAEIAGETIAALRSVLVGSMGADGASRVRILYGGSVTAANISEFVGLPDIDGALVGGASLKAEEFGRIVRSTAAIRCGS